MAIVHISLVTTIALLSLLLGVRVLLIDPNNKVNKSFAFFAVSIALWIIIDFSLYQQALADFQTFLNRLDLSVICLMVLSLAYFVSLFPKELFKMPRFISIVSISATVIVISIILFTRQVVDIAFMQDYGSNFTQGNLFYIFAIFASIFALYSIVVPIIKYYKLSHDEKQQIKFIFYGIVSLVVLNLTFNLFIPMITKSFIYGRFGTYSSILLVIFIAYAILKAKAFNAKIIVTESAVVILNVISIVQIFISNSALESLLRVLFAIIIFYGSWILVQSVRREIKQKEELQDITTQLAQANSHLQELDKMKTEFVSLASHELLTPVSAIEGYLSMLLDEKLAKVEDPKAVKFLDNVYKSAKRLARLVTDLLNISRIEEGRLLVEKQDVNLSDIIQQTVDELKFKAEEGKQQIVFDDKSEIRNPKSEINPNVQNPKFQTFGDGDKIKEIIVNLIGNSIKYSKNPGTITITINKVPTSLINDTWGRVEAEIKNRPLDDQEAIKSAVDPHLRDLVGAEQWLISVKDTGIGIPREELPRLFKKFHRVGDFSTAESQGTGLGLYISRALVELNHGRIWADSEGQGKGSTFSFSLPLLDQKQAIQALEAQAPKTGEQLKPLAKPAKGAEEL